MMSKPLASLAASDSWENPKSYRAKNPAGSRVAHPILFVVVRQHDPSDFAIALRMGLPESPGWTVFDVPSIFTLVGGRQLDEPAMLLAAALYLESDPPRVSPVV
jgi:hypothetical protein